MLGISAATQFMSGPGQSYSVAAFKDPMRNDLEVSETSYSLAYGFATLLSGVCLPWIGRLVDRHGARRVLPIIATLLGVACWWMSRIDSLLGLYLGFSGIRCLGQGALTLISMWIVGEWFARRRGFAAAIAGLGGSLSVMCFPIFNAVLISRFGWQTTWFVLGLAVWGVLIVPAIVLLRDRPEDLGLYPDGIAPSKPGIEKRTGTSPASAEHLPTEHSWTVREVLRTAAFWKLLVVPVSAGMIVTGLTFHQVALLGTRGVSPTWALGLISVQASIATVCSLPAGRLTDRVAGRKLLSIAMVLLAAASFLILITPIPQLTILYAVLLGLQGSILRSTGNVIWLTYFGRTHQGGIRGIAMSAMILAAAIGPLPFALSIDELGSYDAALVAFILIPLVSAAIAWTARPPLRSAA